MDENNQNTLLQPNMGGFHAQPSGLTVCPFCGISFSTNYRFCPNCGHSVGMGAPSAVASPQYPPAPAYPPQHGNVGFDHPYNPNFTPGPQPMPKRKSAVGIVGFVFIFISLLIVIIAIASNKHGRPYEIFYSIPTTIIGHILCFIGIFKRPKAIAIIGFILSVILLYLMLFIVNESGRSSYYY